MAFGSKNGQAMIEFMMGLVGIVILLLGLDLVAHIVSLDFETIYNARIDVAEDLISGSTTAVGASGAGYDPSDSLGVLNANINGNSSGAYENYQGTYPQMARTDGFAFLAQNSDPLDQNMVGSEKGSSIDITSTLMRQILGRSSINIDNAVWMPPLGDLQ